MCARAEQMLRNLSVTCETRESSWTRGNRVTVRTHGPCTTSQSKDKSTVQGRTCRFKEGVKGTTLPGDHG